MRWDMILSGIAGGVISYLLVTVTKILLALKEIIALLQ